MRILLIIPLLFSFCEVSSQNLNLDSIQWISDFTTSGGKYYATGFRYKKDGYSNFGKVVCLDNTLKLMWSKRFDTTPKNEFQGIVARHDTLFVTALHGKSTVDTHVAKRHIYLINSKTGKTLFNFELEGSSGGHSNIVLRGNILYIAYSKSLSPRFRDLAGHQVVLSAVNLSKKTVKHIYSKTFFGGPSRLEIYNDQLIALGSYYSSARDEHSKIFFYQASLNKFSFVEKVDSTDENQIFSTSLTKGNNIYALVHTRNQKAANGDYQIIKFDLAGNVIGRTPLVNDGYEWRYLSQGNTSDANGFYIISEKVSEKRKHYLLYYDQNGKKISEKSFDYPNEFPWRYYPGSEKGYIISNDDNLNHEYFLRRLGP